MKAKRPNILNRILCTIGMELIVLTTLTAIFSILILKQIIPQNYDHICAVVALGLGCFAAVKCATMHKRERRLLYAVIVASGNLALFCFINLFFKQGNFQMLPMNAIVIFACSILAVVTAGRKRGKYRIKY